VEFETKRGNRVYRGKDERHQKDGKGVDEGEK